MLQQAVAGDSSVFSPNKVMSLDENKQQESPQKRISKSAKTQLFKERNSLQLQSLSPQDFQKLKGAGKGLTDKNMIPQAISKSGVLKKKDNKGKKNIIAKIFEGVIMTLIIISSITLVIDNPLTDPEAELIEFVGYLDNCFTVLFTLEALIKIIAMGFFFSNPTL